MAEVTGSNPAEAWIFFRLLFRNCLNCVSTAKIFHDVIYNQKCYAYVNLSDFFANPDFLSYSCSSSDYPGFQNIKILLN